MEPPGKTVELSKDHPNENKQIIYSELAISRQSATMTLDLAEPQTQAEEWSFIQREKDGEASSML